MFGKIKKYLLESWGEIKPNGGKVSWPSGEDVKGSTAVVVATVGIAAVYLFGLDLVAGWVMSLIFGYDLGL